VLTEVTSNEPYTDRILAAHYARSMHSRLTVDPCGISHPGAVLPTIFRIQFESIDIAYLSPIIANSGLELLGIKIFYLLFFVRDYYTSKTRYGTISSIK